MFKVDYTERGRSLLVGKTIGRDVLHAFRDDGYVYVGAVGVTDRPEKVSKPAGSPAANTNQIPQERRSRRISADGHVYVEVGNPRLKEVAAKLGALKALIMPEDNPQPQFFEPMQGVKSTLRAEEYNPSDVTASGLRRGHKWKRQLLQNVTALQTSYSTYASSLPANNLRLVNTLAPPNCAIGGLTFTVDPTSTTSTTWCTGVWVSPWDVLTAAHCVYDAVNQFAYSNWAFSPAMNGTAFNYGTVQYAWVTFYDAFINSGYSGTCNGKCAEFWYNDIALIRMRNASIEYLAISPDAYDLTSFSGTVCGYPFNQCPRLLPCPQYCSSCQVTVESGSFPFLSQSCYTWWGMDGGPLMTTTNSVFGVYVGVTNEFPPGTNTINQIYAPIDRYRYNDLTSWMCTTWLDTGISGFQIAASNPQFCLTLTLANGVSSVSWTSCLATNLYQYWYWDGAFLRSTVTSDCLTADPSGSVLMSACSVTPSKRWTWSSAQQNIRPLSGPTTCLTWSTMGSTQVITRVCTISAKLSLLVTNAIANLRPGGPTTGLTITLASQSNTCLTVGLMTTSPTLVFSSCNWQSFALTQVFMWNNLRIMSRTASICMAASCLAPSCAVTMTTCGMNSLQQWAMDGNMIQLLPIYMNGGISMRMCLTVSGSAPFGLTVTNCNPSSFFQQFNFLSIV